MPSKIDPDVLAEASREVLTLPLESGERIAALIERLSVAYPDIVENRQRAWIPSKAGGILGKNLMAKALRRSHNKK